METDASSLLVAGLELAALTFQKARKELAWQPDELDECVLHQVSAVHTAKLIELLGLDEKKSLQDFSGIWKRWAGRHTDHPFKSPGSRSHSKRQPGSAHGDRKRVELRHDGGRLVTMFKRRPHESTGYRRRWFFRQSDCEEPASPGRRVVSFSRGDYPELERSGPNGAGDIADAQAVASACEGCDTVFHVAAKPGIWGDYKQYYSTNVTGTKNVITACRKNGLPNLSTPVPPASYFRGEIWKG